MPIGKRKTKNPPLISGCNYAEDVFSVGKDQAYKVINCHIDEFGRAHTRKGKRAFVTTQLDGKITSIHDFTRPDGSSFIQTVLVTAGETVYSINTTTGVATEQIGLNSTARPTWVNFQDSAGAYYAFICNGTDFFKFDGTTWSEATANAPWITGAPRYIVEYDNSLIAAGIDSDPYRAYVSENRDGTDWKPNEGAASYWTMKSTDGDRITALKPMYDYCMIFQQGGVEIITEADPQSTTSEQIRISHWYGTTSHWSVQAIGNTIYFADESHIYRGTLRAAVENSLEVEFIDTNILQKYRNVTHVDDIVSVYDAKHKEVQWGIELKGAGRKNMALVYNIGLSGVRQYIGHVDVWSGWFEGSGFEVYSYGTVLDDDRKPVIWCGDEDGYVYKLYEEFQWKDEVGLPSNPTENNIVTSIVTGVIAPYDITVIKRARQFVPKVFQRYDGSATLQWIVDSRYIKPSTAKAITLYGFVPNWEDGDKTRQLQKWGDNVIMAHNPVLVRPITVDEPFHHIQFKLNCAGANARDEISYNGMELWYQPHKIRRDLG